MLGKNMTFRKKFAIGAVWFYVENWVQQISSLMVFAIISRLIGPTEYGLVGLATIIISFSINVANGFVDPIISMRIKDDERLSTVFWLTFLNGMFLSFLCILLAEPFAALMKCEKIVPLLRVYSLFPFLLATASVPTALITQSMNFKVFARRAMIASLIGGIVGIAMAYKGFGGFALVTQQIVVALFNNVILWQSCGWRPRLMLKRGEMTDVFRAGMTRSASSLIFYLEHQLPQFLLGTFLGAESVGLYVFVQRLRCAIEDTFVRPISSVLFPWFSTIRDDFHEQKKILDHAVFIFTALIFPTSWGAAAIAFLFIPQVFGAKWVPAVPLIHILFGASPFVSFGLVLSTVFRAHNKIRAYLNLQAVLVVVQTLTLLLLAPRGVIAFTSGVAGLYILNFIAFTILAEKVMFVPLWRSYTNAFPSMISSAIMIAVIQMMAWVGLWQKNHEIQLALTVLFAGIAYMVAVSGLAINRLKRLVLGLEPGQNDPPNMV
jgi:polysaccharide transporter, PST family